MGRILELGLRQGSWLMEENATLQDDIEDKNKDASQYDAVVSFVVFSVIGAVLLLFGILHGSVRFKP